MRGDPRGTVAILRREASCHIAGGATEKRLREAFTEIGKSNDEIPCYGGATESKIIKTSSTFS